MIIATQYVLRYSPSKELDSEPSKGCQLAANEINPYESYSAEPAQVSERTSEILDGNIWADGKMIVMRREARLPPICIKTGQSLSDDQVETRRLTWYPSWVTLLFLAGGIPGLFAVWATHQSAEVGIGISDEVKRKRKRMIRMAWCVGIAGVALMVLPWFFERFLPDEIAFYDLCVFGGFLMIGLAMFFGGVNSRILRPSKIDKQFIWLKGAHPELLAELPPWAGAPS